MSLAPVVLTADGHPALRGMGDHDSRHIDNTPAGLETHAGEVDAFPLEVRAWPAGVGVTTMAVEVSIPDSGEWVLAVELAALRFSPEERLLLPWLDD